MALQPTQVQKVQTKTPPSIQLERMRKRMKETNTEIKFHMIIGTHKPDYARVTTPTTVPCPSSTKHSTIAAITLSGLFFFLVFMFN